MAAKNVPQKKEDYITNKVLAVFSICLAGVLVLMGLRKLIDFGTTYLLGMTVLRVLMGVAAAGVVLSIVLMAHQKKKGADLTYRILTGRNLLIVFAVALVILALVHHYGIPIFKVFYGLLPALAVYYLIYHSYQPEFCVISVDCGAAVALLLIVRRAQISANVKYLAWVALAVYVALAVVQLTMTAQVKNAKGKLKHAEFPVFKKRLYHADCDPDCDGNPGGAGSGHGDGNCLIRDFCCGRVSVCDSGLLYGKTDVREKERAAGRLSACFFRRKRNETLEMRGGRAAVRGAVRMRHAAQVGNRIVAH